MQTRVITKLIAFMLAFILTFTNFTLLGIYTSEVIALTAEEREEQSKNVNNANMTFDAYFLEGEVGAETKTHSKNINMATNTDTLYLEIKVTDGYLASGTVRITNSNIQLKEIQQLPDSIQSIDLENNAITLNKIDSGETVILGLPIEINTASEFDVENLDRESDVILQGNYINVSGNEREISKDIKVKASMTAEVAANLETEITKYLQDETNNQKRTILQFIIKSNLVNNILPVSKTELEIEIPKINEIAPETISVSALSTKATNGNGRKVYTSSEYTYENGKVGLTITNNETNGKISWIKNVQDEIMITCVYGETVTTLANAEINANSKITPYTYGNFVNGSVNQAVSSQANIGEAVSYKMDVKQDRISKGYMLVEGADNTPYTEVVTIDIGAKAFVDNVSLEETVKYVDAHNNKYAASPVYKYTKVSREDLVGILGEAGYINIYNNENTLIATLNKDNLEFAYTEEISNIKIETSKPITEGIIEIENGREIKPLEYSKTQVALFTKMEMTLNGRVSLNESDILANQNVDLVELENPTEQAKTKLNNNNLSTIVLNEGVRFTTTLKTTDESTVLYKNPTLEYVLPNYIKDVSIKNASLLYDDELQMNRIEIDQNNSGNIILRVLIDGEQTEFNKEALVEGATIIIEADIEVDEFSPSKAENIVVNVTNVSTNNVAIENVLVNFVSQSGLMTLNQMSNFNNEGAIITSINGREETGKLSVDTEAKTANIKITMINNNAFDCNNIVILGRIPFEGNKDIVNNEDLGSNFTAKIIRVIQTETQGLANNYTVYYSENGEATKDLSNASNGWVQNIADLTNVKSYMIVMDNYTLERERTINFNYNVEIPQGLTYEKEAYESYVVFYTNTEATSDVLVAKSAKAGVKTLKEPNLTVELTSNIENDAEVEETQTVTYTAKITNNNNFVQENVYLSLQLTGNVNYISQNGTVTQNEEIQEVTIPVGNIEPNQVKNIEFELQADSYVDADFSNDYITIQNYDENDNLIGEEVIYLGNGQTGEDVNKVTIKAIAKVNGWTLNFESNEKSFEIVQISTEPQIVLSATTTCDAECGIKQIIEYDIGVLKRNIETANNVVVTCIIPDGLSFYGADQDGIYDNNTKTVTWNFATMDMMKNIILMCKTEDLPNELYEKEIPIVFNAKCDESERTFKSNTYNIIVLKKAFTITQTSNINDGSIAQNDEVTYSIKIKNIATRSSEISIIDYLPDGFEFLSCQYLQNNTTRTINNTARAVSIPLTLEANEEITIYLTLKVSDINNVKDRIINKITLDASQIETIESEHINFRYADNGSDNNGGESGGGNGNNSENNNVNNKYNISGVVWVDSNNNATRDTEEELKKDIEVLLIDSQTNNVISKTITDANGAYAFTEIEQGQYVVAFKYDTLEYDITTYKLENVNSTVNSDAIDMLLNIDNNINKYAVTDKLFVSSNLYNIDLGLVISKKFDLELMKSVSLIQTSNSNGTKTYTFDKVSTAKVEIPGKEMVGTVVAVTYNFEIENKGIIAGYTKKIVDYVPNDMKFTADLNPEWYQDTDGNLYNISLANRLLNPGEKIEFSLILTKTMSEENIGVVNNGAEIYESSNDYGIKDVDSTAGNRNLTEDDYGSADAIITVKTGETLIIIGLALIVIAIFGAGIYIIKKKVLTED